MKKHNELASLLAMGLGANNDPYWEKEEKRKQEYAKAYKEFKSERKKQAEVERMQRDGLQPFKYGEHIIYARNQKNADRKAKNKGLI